jgi:hypothetical protein
VIACGVNTVCAVSVVSGVPNSCRKVALVKVFGVSATGMLPNGVLPSRNVTVPVGLVNAFAGLTEPVFPLDGCRKSYGPTNSDSRRVGGHGRRGAVLPIRHGERSIGANSRAEKGANAA